MLKTTHIKYLAILFVLAQSCYYDSQEDLYRFVIDETCTATEATFSQDIVPILEAHCIRCHRNDRQDGNVNLEGYTQVKPYADDGSLLGSTDHTGGFSPMPPSGNKVPFCEIEKIRLWLTAGSLDN